MEVGHAAPDGAADPAFIAARDAWLDDDNQTALPALAKLAAADNHAAQILLGRIAARPLGPWLAGLDKAERERLLRAPRDRARGGNWLHIASRNGSAHARILSEAEAARPNLLTVTQLAKSGEVMLAADIATEHLSSGRANALGLFGLWRDRVFPTYSADLFLRNQLHEFDMTAFETARLLRGAPLFFATLVARGADADAQTESEWRNVRFEIAVEYREKGSAALIKAPATHLYDNHEAVVLAPLRFACEAACGKGQNAADCMLTGANILRFDRMTRYTSPTAILISEDDFAASKRAQSELRHRFLKWAKGLRYDREMAQSLSSCERAAFGLKRQ